MFQRVASVAELSNKNALGAALFLGALSSNHGAQEFKIPAGTNLDGYVSILIHCEKYSKLWGAAKLR